MQFTIAALSVLLPLLVQGSPVSDLAARAGRPTSFEVRTSGSCSGAGTVISPSGSTAKGNFSPSQNSIEVLTAAGNCHVTMYSGSNTLRVCASSPAARG
ncbi:hypothetical protein MMC25_005585 [Agyrium rufum]|nr:hypothetical protein [Agyrium rufum]